MSGIFVGSMPLNSPIYQPIQGIGILCDFTTFYNGVSLVNDPFENVEPAEPKTGVTKFNGTSYTIWEDETTPLEYSTGMTSPDLIKLSPITGIGNNSMLYSATADDKSFKLFYDTGNNRLRMSFDDGPVNTVTNGVGATMPEDSIYFLEWDINPTDIITAKKITAKLYDSSMVLLDTLQQTRDLSLGATSGFAPSAVEMCANLGVLNAKADVYSHTSVMTGNVFYTTRLWPLDDSYNTFTSLLGKVFEVKGSNTSGIVYPNYQNNLNFTGASDKWSLMGTSIGVGSGASGANKYYDVIQKQFNEFGITDVTYTNYSLSGATSVTFAPTGFDTTGYPGAPTVDITRNITKVIADGATVICVEDCQNDVTQGFSTAQKIATLTAMKVEADIAGAILVVCTGVPRLANDAVNAADAVAYTEAVKLIDGIVIVDINDSMSLGGPDFFLNPDYTNELPTPGIHPNNGGHFVLGSTVVQATIRFFQSLAHLVSDTQCAGNNLIIVDGIAITTEDGFARQIE